MDHYEEAKLQRDLVLKDYERRQKIIDKVEYDKELTLVEAIAVIVGLFGLLYLFSVVMGIPIQG